MSVAPKILVADDDQALSRTLSWILKENGYDVFTARGVSICSSIWPPSHSIFSCSIS